MLPGIAKRIGMGVVTALWILSVPAGAVGPQESLEKRVEKAHEGPRGLDEHEHPSGPLEDWLRPWRKFQDILSEHGISLEIGATHIWQGAVNPPNSKNADRFTGSYDLELAWTWIGDNDEAKDDDYGMVLAHAEAYWGFGLDDSRHGNPKLGSINGVNADAAGDQAIQLSELWYEHTFFNRKLAVTFGKMDLTRWFDGNEVANDETAQFLSGSLVNNPTIPFPDYCQGARVTVAPVEGWYVSLGVGDARADGRETGFNTAYHDECAWFGILETGFAVTLGELDGNYRFMGWYSGDTWERFRTGQTERDNIGFAFSADQQVFKSLNLGGHETGPVTLFTRYGFAHHEFNELSHHVSAGGQIEGLLPGRDEDVFGLGVANTHVSRDLRRTARFVGESIAASETLLEIYYNLKLSSWLNVSPHYQAIWNAAGDAGRSTSVFGIRVQMSF